MGAATTTTGAARPRDTEAPPRLRRRAGTVEGATAARLCTSRRASSAPPTRRLQVLPAPAPAPVPDRAPVLPTPRRPCRYCTTAPNTITWPLETGAARPWRKRRIVASALQSRRPRQRLRHSPRSPLRPRIQMRRLVPSRPPLRLLLPPPPPPRPTSGCALPGRAGAASTWCRPCATPCALRWRRRSPPCRSPRRAI